MCAVLEGRRTLFGGVEVVREERRLVAHRRATAAGGIKGKH